MSTGKLRRECSVSEGGKASIPKAVREALGVDNGGKIEFIIEENWEIKVNEVEG